LCNDDYFLVYFTEAGHLCNDVIFILNGDVAIKNRKEMAEEIFATDELVFPGPAVGAAAFGVAGAGAGAAAGAGVGAQ
jgi:hypothetical protein